MRKIISAAIVFVGLSGFAGCERKDDDSKHAKKLLHIPQAPPHRPSGMSALPVRPGPEPFEKSDVESYFKTHNVPMNATTTNDFTVERLEFLTDAEINARLNGASPGRAANEGS